MTGTRRRDESGKWVIDLEHYEIHEGEHYNAFQADETMGDGDEISFTFKTPNTNKHIHMLINWATKAGGHIEIGEAATWGRLTGGTTSIFNSRRQDPNTSGLLNNIAQTAFNQGGLLGNAGQSLVNTTTVLAEYLFGSANKGGGTVRGTSEIILKKNTQYCVRLIADGATNAGFIGLHWYEHELYEIT